MSAIFSDSRTQLEVLTEWAKGDVEVSYRLRNLNSEREFFILISGIPTDPEDAFDRVLAGYQGTGETRTLDIIYGHTGELFRAHFRADQVMVPVQYGPGRRAHWPELCWVEQIR